MSRWFRHYAGMCRDDKLVRVAIRTKQSIERVAWIWGAILESAAEIDDDGRYDFDAAEVAYFLRADEADIHAVEVGLADAGRLAAGVVVKWGDRQFKSDRSAARQADYRERKRSEGRGSDDKQASPNDGVTSLSRHGDAPETETELETQPSLAKASEGKARKRAAPVPKAGFDIPEWVPAEAWQEFVDMRREMERGPKKIPFTRGAAKGIIEDLAKAREAGHDLGSVLLHSVKNGYRGVFTPDTPTKGNAPVAPVEDAAAYRASLADKPWMRGREGELAQPPPRNPTHASRGPVQVGDLVSRIAGHAA